MKTFIRCNFYSKNLWRICSGHSVYGFDCLTLYLRMLPVAVICHCKHPEGPMNKDKCLYPSRYSYFVRYICMKLNIFTLVLDVKKTLTTRFLATFVLCDLKQVNVSICDHSCSYTEISYRSRIPIIWYLLIYKYN